MQRSSSHGTNVQPRQRRDKAMHKLVRRLTESTWFNGGIIFTICVNALLLAMETDQQIQKAWGNVFASLDYVFLSIYTVEFALKVYAEPRGYWTSTYNLFDFAVLIISYVQIIMTAQSDGGEADSKLESLKVLRALRTLRTLRTVSFIRGLQVLVTALIDTVRKWVLNILLLLLLLMFLFAIMGYYFFGYKDNYDKENWGSLGRAMLTLVSFVTVDGWTDKQERLEVIAKEGSRIYTIIFIVLGHFIFTNVFIGVIIINISEATENYKREQQAEREAVLRHKKEFMMIRQHSDVKQMLERQKKGQYANFQEMVNDFQKSLRHDDSVMMSDLCTNIVWLETYIRTLEHMDNTMYRIQQLHFEMANTLAHIMETRLKKRYGM